MISDCELSNKSQFFTIKQRFLFSMHCHFLSERFYQTSLLNQFSRKF